MKRVFAIHDISGIGKCSLTAAIPIISAAGIECDPIPTAVLSSHTGNIEGYTFRDLTDDIIPYINHWKSLGIKPDTIYSGYLGSIKQIDAVNKIIDYFSDDNTIIVIDPAMADSGKMYVGFERAFVEKMSSLCKRADVITPNLTESAFMSGIEYNQNYSIQYIDKILEVLSSFTKRYVIITGVSDEKDKTGCLVYDKIGKLKKFYSTPKCQGIYYGTGDIFSSALTAMLTDGFDCFEAAEKAINFTYKSINETYIEQTDTRFGVAFEKFLPELFNLR